MYYEKTKTKEEAWLALIAGLIVATVFTFGMPRWNAPVAREEATAVTAIYAYCKETTHRGHVNDVILRFTDHDQLEIDNTCVTTELLENIRSLTPGTKLFMLVRPDSDVILELRTGDSIWLDFQDASDRMANVAGGFMILGIILYIGSAICGVRLLVKKDD